MINEPLEAFESGRTATLVERIRRTPYREPDRQVIGPHVAAAIVVTAPWARAAGEVREPDGQVVGAKSALTVEVPGDQRRAGREAAAVADKHPAGMVPIGRGTANTAAD